MKAKIGDKYGALNEFYKELLNFNHDELMAFRTKDETSKTKNYNMLLDIEDYLESMGIEDGRDITTVISNDFGDIVVKGTIDNLNKLLVSLGVDFETMRQALNDRYWN